jgi:hypothetical protein
MIGRPHSTRKRLVVSAAVVTGILLAASPNAVATTRIRQVSTAANEVAIGGGYAVWTSHDPDSANTDVRERRLAGGRVRVAVAKPIALDGLASTARWLLYTPQFGRSIGLIAYERRTGLRRVLSRDVIARIAQDGDRIAWAERAHGRQRVVVIDVRTGRKWIAANLPMCSHGRCYRFDAVVLARWGVWFVRGALGPFPSQVIRRTFGAHRLQTLRVAHDPQPDAVAGAGDPVFFRLGSGYVRWPGGRLKSTRLAAVRRHDTLLRVSRRSFEVLRQIGRVGVIIRIAGGRERIIDRGPHAPHRGAAPLASIAWRGAMFVAAWNVYPPDGDGPGDDPSYSEIHVGDERTASGAARLAGPQRVANLARQYGHRRVD